MKKRFQKTLAGAFVFALMFGLSVLWIINGSFTSHASTMLYKASPHE